jgi:hypothetical protein
MVQTLKAFHFNKILLDNGNAMLYELSFKGFIMAASWPLKSRLAGESQMNALKSSSAIKQCSLRFYIFQNNWKAARKIAYKRMKRHSPF